MSETDHAPEIVDDEVRQRRPSAPQLAPRAPRPIKGRKARIGGLRASAAHAFEQRQFFILLPYAAIFGMRNVPEDQMQPFMLAEAPRLLFPFARRVLADAIRDGGFPPLLLDPIDFGGLYVQQAQAMAQTAGEPAGHA